MVTPNGNGLRILIAEDVAVLAKMLSRLLVNAGHVTSIASDGEQCLELARSDKPDLILLDLLMPKMHGLEVLRHLRDDPSTADIHVIVCSAKNYKTEMDQARELGAEDFLIKPVQRDDLFAAIDRASRQGSIDLPAIEEPSIHDRFAPVLEAEFGSFCLWGTRGSIPISGPKYLRHGGNTSCLELNVGSERIIFDAGSGIRDLGAELAKQPPQTIHLFITHTHWDHIQGFPFFAPIHMPNFDIHIYGASDFEKDLPSIFRGQLDRAYFPVQMEDLNAQLTFHDLPDAPIAIGDASVTWEYVNHPGNTVGYKATVGDRSIVWIPDNEFLAGYEGAPEFIRPDDERASVYEKIIDFIRDVDVLIHEAQYTNEEYSSKIGWGHTCVSNACVLMKLARIRRWIVTHHDPMHDDDFLQHKLNLTRQLLQRIGCKTTVDHAYDGMTDFM